MSTIVTRAGKGDTLSWTEVDSNFTNLNTDKIQATNGAGTNGQVLTSDGTNASWQTPAGGGNNIIEITTGNGYLAMPGDASSNTTSTFSVRSSGGVSGVSATTGTFTLPSGTYLMKFPYSCTLSSAKSDVNLVNNGSGSTITSFTYQSVTIGGTSGCAQYGTPILYFTLSGSTTLTFRNGFSPTGSYNITTGAGSGYYGFTINKVA